MRPRKIPRAARGEGRRPPRLRTYVVTYADGVRQEVDATSVMLARAQAAHGARIVAVRLR